MQIIGRKKNVVYSKDEADDNSINHIYWKNVHIGLLPHLRGNHLKKEADRLFCCGAQYNTFKCIDNDKHEADQKHLIAFSYYCELRICPRCTKKRGNKVRKEVYELLKHKDKTKTHKYSLLTVTVSSNFI